MHRLISMLMVFVAILGFSSLANADINIHHEAEKCRKDYTPNCDLICKECHLPPYGDTPSWKVDIHSESDRALCAPCHSEKLDFTKPGNILPGHDGNHPSGIYYDPSARPGARLKPLPIGPKLICDPVSGRCKVMCSTCHNPMGNNRFLHRFNSPGCLLCHDM